METTTANPAPPQVNLYCRMYENKLPEPDICVMVNVRQITDVGTYVTLLEYNNIEGMILLSELTRRRYRSIGKLVRVGKNEVAVVMRVDKDKGYIDLSKRRAAAEDIAACEERYQKSKQVHSIMRYVAERVQMDLERLYELYGWPLYRQYGHAYEAFKNVLVDDESVFGDLDMPDYIRRELVTQIKKRLTPQPIKIRSDIDVSCFAYEGIDAVKKALLAGQQCSTPEVELKVKLIAPPLYVIESNCIDKNLGIKVMEEAIEQVEKVITQAGGNLVVKMKPRAVSQTDEQELENMIKAANGDGDSDGDSEVDE